VRPAAPASGPYLRAAYVSGLHWHAQSPYLFGLPNDPHFAVVLPTHQSSLLEAPRTPPRALVALPFARGPPSAPSLPTSLVS
jgi:hypothetical protein